jgi:hypothetical protein
LVVVVLVVLKLDLLLLVDQYGMVVKVVVDLVEVMQIPLVCSQLVVLVSRMVVEVLLTLVVAVAVDIGQAETVHKVVMVDLE